jgi:hypothetical protein
MDLRGLSFGCPAALCVNCPEIAESLIDLDELHCLEVNS